MLTTLALCALIQDDYEAKLAKMRDLRARMKAEIEKVDADIKELEAAAKKAKTHKPQDDSGLADEVRALRKEVAELRGLIKEAAAARDFKQAVEAPAAPRAHKAPSPVMPPPVHDGKMKLQLGPDAEGLKEIWVVSPDGKEPMKFVPAPPEKKEKKAEKKPEKTEKKPEKSERRPEKAEKKPDAADDEQLEERRGLLRRMYEKRKAAEDPEARRLMDEMKKDDVRIEQGRKTLQKLIEEEKPKCECEEECPFKEDSPPRATGIWY